MAEAIQRVVPGALLVYGPPLDTGFYYDIAFPDDRPLREGDFEAIEKEMAAIIKEDRPFCRYELPGAEGVGKLEAEGNKYKLDNAQRALEAGGTTISGGPRELDLSRLPLERLDWQQTQVERLENFLFDGVRPEVSAWLEALRRALSPTGTRS